MYYGWPSLCLNVRNLERSTRFYESLGMQVMREDSAPGARVVLRFGGFRLGLFVGINSNSLNFRGADVFAAHKALSQRLPGLEGEPQSYLPNEEYGANAAGCCWLTRDPDQNVIFFDTNENEKGESYKQRQIRKILCDAEHELASIDADECLEVLRSELIDRFCSSE